MTTKSNFQLPNIPGMDASSMDPKMMSQLMQSLQRLPRGQLIRLQTLMNKAMQGQDVGREAAELERMLPPEFKAFALAIQNQWVQKGNPMANLAQANAAASGASEAAPSVEEAQKIVEEAVAQGKLSKEEGIKILEDSKEKPLNSKGLFGRLFSKNKV